MNGRHHKRNLVSRLTVSDGVVRHILEGKS